MGWRFSVQCIGGKRNSRPLQQLVGKAAVKGPLHRREWPPRGFSVTECLHIMATFALAPKPEILIAICQPANPAQLAR
jgi:hypothetical protein